MELIWIAVFVFAGNFSCYWLGIRAGRKLQKLDDYRQMRALEKIIEEEKP